MSGWILYGLVLGLVIGFAEGSPVVATSVVVALGFRFVVGAWIAVIRGRTGLVLASLLVEAAAVAMLWPVLVFEDAHGFEGVWPWAACAVLLTVAATWMWRRVRTGSSELRAAEASSRDDGLLRQWFYLWLPARS